MVGSPVGFLVEQLWLTVSVFKSLYNLS